MNKRMKIALLVDYDNFNQDEYFDILFEELDEMGDLIVRRVYFSNEEGKSLTKKFRNLGLDPIYQLRFSKGKNAVDIRMSIEAIELLKKDYIDTFALATHDSDFTPLVNKLKENNKRIIGAGRDNVSKFFKDACDVFVNVEQIHKAKSLPSKETKEIIKLVNLINTIIDQNSESNEGANLAIIAQQLRLKDKQFNPKNYGAPNNKILPFFQTKLKPYFKLSRHNTTWKVKKVNKDNEQAVKILNDFYKNNSPAVVQNLKRELQSGIKNFTFKLIGERQMKTFLTNNGYIVKGNVFKKR